MGAIMLWTGPLLLLAAARGAAGDVFFWIQQYTFSTKPSHFSNNIYSNYLLDKKQKTINIFFF
jgi:hypothetical protein